MVLGGVVLGLVVDLVLTGEEVEGRAEVEGVVFLVKDRVVVLGFVVKDGVVVLGFVVEGLADVLDTRVAPAVVDPAAEVAALDVEAPGVVDAPFVVEAAGEVDAP